MNQQPIDVPAEVNPQAVAVREQQPSALAPSNLFGAADAVAVVQKASAVASALRDVIEAQGLISNISGKKYPKCEAWTLLGTMLGVFPVLQWSRKVENGWEARVEARTRDGAVVGAAEAECLRSERNWANRDDFALRSMAQTRATAKALRMPLGFVMTLSGYEPTPAEEMAFDHAKEPKRDLSEKGTKTPQKGISGAGKGNPVDSDQHLLKLKARMVEALAPERDLAESFFRTVDWLMPNETIESLELRYVPQTKEEFDALVECIHGSEPVLPYKPHTEQVAEKPKVQTKEEQPNLDGQTAGDEWWRGVIIPVPHKGQKRDDYMRNPETIGQLYDMRHGNDEESQAARQRLWGFIERYEAKGWEKRDGTKMPPSEADKKFRQALDACADWHEKNHPEEKL